MSEKPTIEFPTEFPIKVMGRKDSDIAVRARQIIEKHAGALSDDQVRERPSSGANFLALTFVIQATSQAQLDAIYRELTACDAVLMAL
jgi:putative lipoic acid-binding regulatory protein